MEIAAYSIAGVTTVLLGAALLVVWSRRDMPWLRALATPAAIIAAIVSAGVVANTLGNAVPLIGGITAPPGKAPLLSVKAAVGKGIYLTIDLPDAPRLYWLPWDMKTAEMLQEMIGDPNNGGVIATIPEFEFSWDIGPPTFQPIPQPKWLPDKPEDAAPPAPHFSA